MKKMKINKKVLAILLSTGIVFSLAGCNTNNKDDSSMQQDIVLDYENDGKNEADSNDTLSSEEFDYFSSDLAEVEDLIEINNFDQVKSKAKDVFVTGVDFVFYDGVISGVTFDELTEEGKEITMNNLDSLGNMVDQVAPGWRNELSDKYLVASEFVGDMYLSTLDKIREYLGDENYEALGNIKDKIFGDVHNTYDDMHDTYDDAKEHVKLWYEEFRSRK